VYQFLTDAIEADQYHQETYVNKMKEMTTYSLVDFERRSHGPSSGMFLEFQFGERPETILETLREDRVSTWSPGTKYRPSSKHRFETRTELQAPRESSFG